MIGLEAETLSADDRRRLASPAVGAVILFSRNFRDVQQLTDLVGQIRQVRPHLLITVDHEGGRVQRFREGFTHLPAMGRIGRLYDRDQERSLEIARQCGWVLAAELRACDLDFSFAPVLDLDYGHSEVIGDRSFHRRPEVVVALASALIEGMAQAGMGAVGKHFPGHGYVAADSHLEMPVDQRTLAQMGEDLAAFDGVIAKGLAGIMPAHVVYTTVDDQPAGYSTLWLQQILRERMAFEGLIFSDDLAMAGALSAGNMTARARTALAAGCDMVLVCNEMGAMDEAIRALENAPPVDAGRYELLTGKAAPATSLEVLRQSEQWQRAVAAMDGLPE